MLSSNGSGFIFDCHPLGASPHFLSTSKGEAEPAAAGSSREQSGLPAPPAAWAAGPGQPSSWSPEWLHP